VGLPYHNSPLRSHLLLVHLPIFFISELRHVPTVPAFPLWGQFFEIITTECGVPQRKWHQEHGSIIRYFFPFEAERLAIADDKAIHQMTIKNPYNYPKLVRAELWMVRILGDGILLAEGSEHATNAKPSPQDSRFSPFVCPHQFSGQNHFFFPHSGRKK